MSNAKTNLAFVPLHPACVNKKEPVRAGGGTVAHARNTADSTASLNGKMKAVGKNPHLITVIPERTDFVLKQNDIVSMGRRDREPWMRFQVVQANGASNNRRESRRRERKRQGADGQTRSVDNVKSTNTPPEWIITTRKRKVARMSSPPPKPSNALKQQSTTNTDQQKRRRKRSRESSFLLSPRAFDESNPKDKHFPPGQNKAAYGHLVVQDCKKSASLLDSDRKKRREISEVVESQSGRLHGGRLPFLSKSTNEKSKKKTTVVEMKELQETMQPNGSKEGSEVQRVPCTTQPHSLDAKGTRVSSSSNQLGDKQLKKDCEIGKVMNRGQPDLIVVSSPPNQPDNDDETRHSLPPTEERSKRDESVASAKGQAGSTLERSNHPRSLSAKDAESSIMNMPAVGSTFEGTNHQTTPTPPLPTTRSVNGTVQYSHAELHYWQKIAKGEPGDVSAFRRALASLIVAKNRGKERGDSMWLPDLLDDGVTDGVA
ncbi:MAG: hypothetical protein SGBAC_011674 [Bacillariaceae sp.]